MALIKDISSKLRHPEKYCLVKHMKKPVFWGKSDAHTLTLSVAAKSSSSSSSSSSAALAFASGPKRQLPWPEGNFELALLAAWLAVHGGGF
jgi:hypothetical protein